MGVPAVTSSSSIATEHKYLAAVDATPEQVFVGRGNLFGFWGEENSGSAVYVQFFNAAAPGDVTVGTTPPAFTMRISANGSFGKDVNDSPLHFFDLGCVVAVTTTRAGSTDPGAGMTFNAWYWNH